MGQLQMLVLTAHQFSYQYFTLYKIFHNKKRIFEESYTFFCIRMHGQAVMALIREKEIENSASEMVLDAIECGRP
jgi:hypothetical protein